MVTKAELMGRTAIGLAGAREEERKKAGYEAEVAKSEAEYQAEVAKYETEVKKQQEEQAMAEAEYQSAQQEYERQQQAYEWAEQVLKRGVAPDWKNAPVGSYQAYKELWSRGYGQGGTYASQVGPEPNVFYVTNERGEVTGVRDIKKGVSIPWEEYQKQITTPTILTPPDIKTWLGQQVEKQKILQPVIEKYKQAGYTTKEAKTLAEFEQEYQVTPTPQYAEYYLRQEKKIAPSFAQKPMQYISYQKGRLFETLGKAGAEEFDITVSPFGLGIKPKILRQIPSMVPSKKLPKEITEPFFTTATYVGHYFIPYVGQYSFYQDVLAVGEKGLWSLGKKPANLPLTTGEKAILVTAGVAPIISSFYKPIAIEWFRKVTKPISEVGKTTFTSLDIIQPIEIKGKVFEKGGFILKTTIPEQKFITTTRLREFFGAKPIETIIKPTKIYVSYTPFGMITKEGKIIGEAPIISKRVGAKFGTIETITGAQVRITPEEFMKLPSEQKYIYQKMAEIKTGGRPVSMKIVPKILGKDFEYSIGQLELIKKGRIYPRAKEIKFFYPQGRTTTRGAISTMAKEIKIPKLEELGIQKFKTITGIKDITYPFSRQAGKIPMIKGTTYILPSKEIKEVGGTILKLKVSPKSIQTIKQVEVLIAKTIPKPSIPKLPKVKTINIFKRVVPTARAITAIEKISPYYGTGQYERTDGGLISSTIEKQQVQSMIKPTQIQIIRQVPKIEQKQIQVLKTIQQPKEIQILRQPTKQLEQLKTMQNLKQIQQLKQLQQLKQIQVLKPIQVTKQIQRYKQPKPIPPPPPIIKLPKRTSKLPIASLKKLAKGYRIWIKRKGKYKPLGKILPKSEAIRLGEKITRQTLAASFRITPTNIGVRPPFEEYAPSPLIFRAYKIRKGKRIPLVEEWIQKAGTRLEPTIKGARLAGREERIEILKSKKEGKKLRWL